MQIDELARAYQSKSDEELLLLSRKPQELTPEAQSLLRGELARRRIAADTVAVAAEESELAAVLSKIPVPKPVAEGAKSSGEFLKEVTLLYRDHFWLFIKLVAPAVVIGYLIVTEIRAISREMVRGLTMYSSRQLLDAVTFRLGLLNAGGQFVSGLIFCLSFAAICAAVARITRGHSGSTLDFFTEARRRVGSFLSASVVLVLLIFAAFAICSALIIGYYWLGSKVGIRVNYCWTFGITYLPFFGAMLLLSRLALAMPAIIVDDLPVGQAFFRSDELTKGKWMVLASLLAKSVIGGYIAGMLPFWVAELIWRWVHLPTWGLDAASVVGVTMVEPFMFIGFALMYVQGRPTHAVE